MTPQTKLAARTYLEAHKAYHDNRRAHWPYAHNDIPQYLAMLDAMCNLATAARIEYPFLYQNDRFHRHILRLANRNRFTPEGEPQGYAIVAPPTIPRPSFFQ